MILQTEVCTTVLFAAVGDAKVHGFARYCSPPWATQKCTDLKVLAPSFDGALFTNGVQEHENNAGLCVSHKG